MSDILVFIEHQDGKVKKTSLELLSKAADLVVQAGSHQVASSGGTGGSVSAVLIGSSVSELVSQLTPYGAKKVYLVCGASFEKYNTIAYCQVLSAVIDRAKPGIVLGTASAVGKDLFPRLAAKIKTGLASDCTDLRIEGGKLIGHRPVYSGKAFVDVAFNTPIQLATTRANSFPIKAPQEGIQVATP